MGNFIVYFYLYPPFWTLLHFQVCNYHQNIKQSSKKDEGVSYWVFFACFVPFWIVNQHPTERFQLFHSKTKTRFSFIVFVKLSINFNLCHEELQMILFQLKSKCKVLIYNFILPWSFFKTFKNLQNIHFWCIYFLELQTVSNFLSTFLKLDDSNKWWINGGSTPLSNKNIIIVSFPTSSNERVDWLLQAILHFTLYF